MISINYNTGNGGFIGVLFALVTCIILIAAMWKIFVKAGKPGWAVFVPFYGNYCQFDITFGCGWLFLLMFVPCVNFVIMIMLYFKLAKVFGKGVWQRCGIWVRTPVSAVHFPANPWIWR